MAYERFLEAREAGAPEGTLLKHLNDAAQQVHRALELLPPNAVDDLAQEGMISRTLKEHKLRWLC